MRSFLAAFILLFVPILSASEAAAYQPHCAASLLLPEGLHLLEAPGCFSPDVAEELSTDVDALGDYLDRFPGVPAVHAYRYWQYLRTERFLPALLTLVELVNGASSLAPAAQFRDEVAFLVISGIKGVPHDVDLFARSGARSADELSARFFFILDQVVSLYADGRAGSRRDSWLIYRSLALFFANSNGPAATEDAFANALLDRYYALWKEGVLLPYLAFYTFFTVGDRAFLPAESLYTEKLAVRIPLPKSRDERKEQAALENIARLMGRFSIEHLPLLPVVEFVATDDVGKWFRETRPAADKELDEACAVFDERQTMLAPYRDDLFEPFIYNRAISLMEGCDPRHAIPFAIEGRKIYVARNDRWLRDIAVIYYLVREGRYSYREASGLLSGAMLSSVARYREEGTLSPFGKALLYAYHTDRIANFRDALFLYRQYGDEQSEFTREKIAETTDFVTSFFLGAREEEK